MCICMCVFIYVRDIYHHHIEISLISQILETRKEPKLSIKRAFFALYF